MFDMAAIPFHALNDLNFREMGEHVHRRKSIDIRDVRNLVYSRLCLLPPIVCVFRLILCEPKAALPIADQTVTTILPICSLDSRKRVASWIWSNGKVRDTKGSSLPLSKPSVMKALARASASSSPTISV